MPKCQKFKWDILSNFQTLCTTVKFFLNTRDKYLRVAKTKIGPKMPGIFGSSSWVLSLSIIRSLVNYTRVRPLHSSNWDIKQHCQGHWKNAVAKTASILRLRGKHQNISLLYWSYELALKRILLTFRSFFRVRVGREISIEIAKNWHFSKVSMMVISTPE